ncbi:MAG TPA: hypothetical protein VMB50_10740 [Myxococcales bacterium]|nr:hypothetical protein [Myxococcales bacterium]
MIRSILRPAPQILLAIAMASCGSQSTSCGCLGTFAPLAAPLDTAHTTQAGAQGYVTPGGFSFLDANVSALVGALLPTGLTFQIPEISNDVETCPVGGSCPDVNGSCEVLGADLCITEYSYYVCRASDCPYSGDTADCTGNGADPQGACGISAVLDGLTIDTVTPNVLNATVTLNVDYSQFGLNGSSQCVQGGGGNSCRNIIWINASALGFIPLSCDSPGIELTIDKQPIVAQIQLTIDPISQALGVAVGAVTGPNGGALFSASDINFNCGITGDILNFVSSYVVGLFNSQIQSMLTSTVGSQLDKTMCMPQNYYTGAVCPTSATGVTSVPGTDQAGDAVCCAPGSACAGAGGGAGCVVKPLGLVGTANLQSFLASYGAPDAQLQLEVFPGQNLPPSQEPLIGADGGGLRARVITGAEALTPSSCVPTRPAPPATPQADIDFDTEAKNVGISSYMVGVGLSDTFLNQAAYEAYNSGLICLDINSYNESLLSTALLTPVLPSLGYIAPNNAAWAVLRPQNPPTITIGSGIVQTPADGGAPQILDPLLNVSMKDLRIDLFASVDERPVRLFSISTDVQVPLALAVGADGTSIDVVLGNLNNILVNLNASQSNILAEDPTQLLKLIPLVLQLAGPSLGNMPSFDLPSLIAGIGLTLDGIHGIVPDGDGGYADIGIFADLSIADGGGPLPAPPGVPVDVSIVANQEPSLADVGPGGKLTHWPTAIVAVDQSARPTESSWSIDDGMWSAWVQGGQLAVTAPSFLLQGHHSILLRTRPQGSRGAGWTATLDFLADYTPPTVDLEVDAAGRWALSAQDNLTPAEQLQWSTSVAGAPFSAWATGTPDPNALAAGGAFVVRVRDQAGNVAQAMSDPSLVAGGAAEGGSKANAPAAHVAPSTGCGSAPGEPCGCLALLAALGLTRLRRRRAR